MQSLDQNFQISISQIQIWVSKHSYIMHMCLWTYKIKLIEQWKRNKTQFVLHLTWRTFFMHLNNFSLNLAFRRVRTHPHMQQTAFKFQIFSVILCSCLRLTLKWMFHLKTIATIRWKQVGNVPSCSREPFDTLHRIA